MLKKNSILVKEGQKVYPDTPIALAGTYDTPENGQVRFSVYYLNNDKKKKKKENLSNQTHYNAFINPKFLTTGGEKYLAIQAYNQVVVTDDLVEAEMTKRERKKRKKH